MNGLWAILKKERKRTDLPCRDQNLLTSVASILEATVKAKAEKGGGGGGREGDWRKLRVSAGAIAWVSSLSKRRGGGEVGAFKTRKGNLLVVCYYLHLWTEVTQNSSWHVFTHNNYYNGGTGRGWLLNFWDFTFSKIHLYFTHCATFKAELREWKKNETK